MESVARGRHKIDSIENGFAVSDVVKGMGFRRVEKMARAQAVKGDKVPQLGRSPSEGSVLAICSKRTPGGLETSKGSRSQTRFGGRIYYQARFIPVLRVGC